MPRIGHKEARVIRKATREDIPELLMMCSEFYKESHFQEILEVDFDPKGVALFIKAILDSDGTQSVILVDDSYRGMVGGLIGPLVMSPTQRIATEAMWWVAPEFRGTRVAFELFRAYVSWARECGVAAISMVALEHLDGSRVGKFYERLGLTKSEVTYMAPLRVS